MPYSHHYEQHRLPEVALLNALEDELLLIYCSGMAWEELGFQPSYRTW